MELTDKLPMAAAMICAPVWILQTVYFVLTNLYYKKRKHLFC